MSESKYKLLNNQLGFWIIAGWFIIALLVIAWQRFHYRDQAQALYAASNQEKIRFQRFDVYCERLLTQVGTLRAALLDPKFSSRASMDLITGPLGDSSNSTLQLCAPLADLSRLELCYITNDVECMREVASAVLRAK